MSVLVTATSKHEATTEIAETIASVLRESEYSVDVQPPERPRSAHGSGTVALGSAVDAGRWMDEVKQLAERHRRELAAIS